MFFNRKAGSILLSLVLSLSVLLSACSNTGDKAPESTDQSTEQSNEQTTPQTEADASTEQNEEPVEFSYLLGSRFIGWLNDLNWYPELLKRTNTKITIVDGGDANQYDANVDSRIGGGDFPDAGIVTLAQAEVYGSQGAFVDLKPLIEEHAPNIQKYIEANPDFKNLITASNGKIYGLIVEYPRIARVPFYREDMFTKAGVPQEPKTIEELTDAFRKLKAHYGKDDKNYYPFSGRDNFITFAEAFHANDGIEKGKVHGIYKSGSG